MPTRKQFRMPFAMALEPLNARLSDPAYYPHKHRAIQAWDIAEQPLEATAQAPGELCVRYTMKASASVPLPAPVRKLLGGALTVVQTDRWNASSRTGGILIEVRGLPIRMESSARLEADGDRTWMVSDWTFTCGVPLVGGAIERLLADDVESRLKLECAAA